MVKLGDRVRDSVTGFTGIAVARTEWLHGCDRIVIQPDKLDKDGKVQPNESFDEPQVIVLQAGKIKRGNKNTGGPRPTPMQKPNVA